MIDKTTINEAIRLLIESGKPKCIILFGSYGRGSPKEDSDLDFLVIQSEVKDRRQEMVRLRRVLRPLRIPADIIVVSEKSFKEWSDTPGNILFEAATEGQVVYEKA